MTLPQNNSKAIMPQAQLIHQQLNSIVLGNEKVNRLAICCILAGGHLLLEDIPGVGKTTLAYGIAKTLGLTFNRVQFTSDLLPTDLIGVSIYDPNKQQFNFQAGPLFTSVLLADEINRASPKTQSALLQAMEEKRVSIDTTTRELESPFFVIATQNPLEQSGTFPLPESQLDRFLMRLSLGYPDQDSELSLLKNNRPYTNNSIETLLNPTAVIELMDNVNQVHCSDSVVSYLHKLLVATRNNPDFVHGLSPRAGLQWIQASRAWAFLEQRDFIVPEDIQAVAPSVALHRLQSLSGKSSNSAELAFQKIMQDTPIN